MTDLVVIYDPGKEIGAIVNMDAARAFGPAMIGENAGDILQAFIDGTPFDMGDFDTFAACAAFSGFLDRMGAALQVEADASADGAVVEPSPVDVDATIARAEAEAANATDTPAPQPADTDSETPPVTVMQTVRCFNCNGEGMIHFGDDTPDARCGMCGGTGKIEQEVPA